RCAAVGHARTRMAVHALVEPQVDLVVVDLVRDQRRLHRIVARLALVVVDDPGEGRRLRLRDQWNRAAKAGAQSRSGRILLRERWRGQHERRDGEDDAHHALPPDSATGTILTAHFLKSVCREIGSVASSVTLLMSCDASNQGMYTRPFGGFTRPRVST